MYGRIFETLYKGSMVGAGSATFAVWCYVIANMRADDTVGAQVDLNPALIGFILGEKEEVVEWVIERLCAPDPKSTNKNEEGRRLIKLGQYSYRVVSGADYMSIRNEEDRREYFRVKKQEQRAREAALAEKKLPSAQERSFRRKIKPDAPKEVIYAALEGYKGTTHDLAAKLRELHNVEDGEFEPGGSADSELAAFIQAKIAREEEQEEEVKRRLDPNYVTRPGKTSDTPKTFKTKTVTVWDEETQQHVQKRVEIPVRETLRRKIKRAVDNDPITIADAQEARRLAKGEPHKLDTEDGFVEEL